MEDSFWHHAIWFISGLFASIIMPYVWDLIATAIGLGAQVTMMIFVVLQIGLTIGSFFINKALGYGYAVGGLWSIIGTFFELSSALGTP